MLVYELLTRSALLDLFRRNTENRENLDRYLSHHVRHFRSRLYLCIDLEASKEFFDLLKVVQKRVLGLLVCQNVLSCLRNIVIKKGPRADVVKDTH